MICSKCLIDKPKSEFRKYRQCIGCMKAWHADHYKNPEVKARYKKQGEKWRAANREKQRAMDLKSRLKIIYKITLEQYRDLLESQKGGCAICGSSDPKRKNALRLFVDHNHKTNKIRGLLCHPCNLLMGQAEDNINILEKAISYIKSST